MDKKNLPIKGFEGYIVANENGAITICGIFIKKLGVRIEDHMVREDLYVYPMGVTPQIII